MVKKDDKKKNAIRQNQTEKYYSKHGKVSNVNIPKFLKDGLPVVLLAGVIGVASFATSFDNEPDYDDYGLTTSKIVDDISDETTLDDIIEMEDSHIIQNIDELEQIVDLSDKLSALELTKYTKGLNEYHLNTNFSLDEVNILIDEFKEKVKNTKVQNNVLSNEDRDFTKLALTLEAYQKSVDKELSNQSYQVLLDYAIPCIKSKVIDACGFDARDVDSVEIGGIKDDKRCFSFTDQETGKKYSLIIDNHSGERAHYQYLDKVLTSIDNWTEKVSLSDKEQGVYDQERNSEIKEGIKQLKTLTLLDCRVTNDSHIEVSTSLPDVRGKIKTMA